MTFLEMARQRRLREGFETLTVGGKVVTAQHEASFASASAFRDLAWAVGSSKHQKVFR
jgi:AraC family transcriptional regulator of adaptative response/methylated-DNA-[protein]-cysteine methyltransferase